MHRLGIESERGEDTKVPGCEEVAVIPDDIGEQHEIEIGCILFSELFEDSSDLLAAALEEFIGCHHHLRYDNLPPEQRIPLRVPGEENREGGMVKIHPLLDQICPERDRIEAAYSRKVRHRLFICGGSRGHLQHQGIREDPGKEDPGDRGGRCLSGLHELHRDDGGGGTDRLVLEPDRF